MPDKYIVTITLVQEGETISAHAISDPLIKVGEDIQPVHLVAQEMLALRFSNEEETDSE